MDISELVEEVQALWLVETNDEVAHLLHAALEKLQQAERADRTATR